MLHKYMYVECICVNVLCVLYIITKVFYKKNYMNIFKIKKENIKFTLTYSFKI